jgi:hypothetical protein
MLKSTYNTNAFDSFVEDIAYESLFNTSKTDELLEKVQATADAAETSEAIAAIDLALTTETEKFNSCLGELKDLASQYAIEEITKDELAARTSPILDELKASSHILGIAEFVDKEDDPITDEEMATLKAVLLGAKEIVSQRKMALSPMVEYEDDDTLPIDEEDSSVESFIDTLSNYMVPTENNYAELQALESLWGLVGDRESKNALKARYSSAKTLLSSGKKKYSKKDYSGAISDFGSAKKEFLSILKAVEKSYRDAGISASISATVTKAARDLSDGESATSVRAKISSQLGKISKGVKSLVSRPIKGKEGTSTGIFGALTALAKKIAVCDTNIEKAKSANSAKESYGFTESEVSQLREMLSFENDENLDLEDIDETVDETVADDAEIDEDPDNVE